MSVVDIEWRQRRIVENEASFRGINERLEAGLRQLRETPELIDFICECGDRHCEETVPVTFEEYEEVRRDPRRFLVVPGHIFPEAERLVARHERFHVLEKIGEAAPIADASDPRGAREP